MKSHCTALLIAAALCGRAGAETSPEHVDVFVAGQNGYFCYRIPALEVAPDGSLLAFAEGRKNNANDPGNNNEIDLVCKRSTDNGRTWSAMTVIEHAGKDMSSANPATVVDRQTGVVWLLYIRCTPNRGTATARPGTDDCRVLARSSDDNGKTWSAPIDLTTVARDRNDRQWRATVVGPGGMIQNRNGRLLAGVWRYEPFKVFAIYSDDHGQSWHRGQFVPEQGGNENQLVELSDGRIVMDFRQESDKPRWMAESRDGGRTWGAPRLGPSVSGPVCCAIERWTLKSAGDDRDRILWTGPKGPGRSELVARVSYDEGRTFPNERLIAHGPAAYSDLAVLKDKSEGVLWERGNRSITFTRLTREFFEAK